MLSDMLNSNNPLVRYGVGALIVFGPLYVLSSYGYRWAWTVAVIAFLGVILRRYRDAQSLEFRR